MNNREFVPVTIAVAVSEQGVFRHAVADSHWIQDEREYKKMLHEIRNSNQLWSLKLVKVSIPYPVQHEDQAAQSVDSDK